MGMLDSLVFTLDLELASREPLIERFSGVLEEFQRRSALEDSFDQEYFVEAARLLSPNSSFLSTELAGFKKESIDTICDLLPKYMRAKNCEPEIVFSEYRIQRRMTCIRDRAKPMNVCFNFDLMCDDQRIATLGFKPKDNEIYIDQIQGTKNHREALSLLHWQRALVGFVIAWAQQNEIEKVVIESVRNNYLAKDTFEKLQNNNSYSKGFTFEEAMRLDLKAEQEIAKISKGLSLHLLPHKGYMLYDVTARKSGFKRRQDRNWELIIH
jgi:hypothetical protein